MAHFEANFHAMSVGTSNSWSVNMKLLRRAVQTEASENFGKKKVGKTGFLYVNSLQKKPAGL